MSWHEKLGDLVLGSGLSNVVASALPDHWQRRARERLGDFNPYNVIAGNHDLMRAARLAWVRAAFDVLDAARKTIDAGYSEYDRSTSLSFEKLAHNVLLKVRSDALDRRTNPGDSPIDYHLEIIIQGTSEFVAPGKNRVLGQSLTHDFDNTLAALTGWPLNEMPPIFTHIAQAGLPTVDKGGNRQFNELVFAAFAELLKSPDQYPETMPAFTIAMNDAARALSQEILQRTKGIDEKFDAVVANNDALQIFKTGAEAYLGMLPQLLEGQMRIEALLKDGVSRILQSIEQTAKSSSADSEEETLNKYQKILAHLDQREFDQLLAYVPNSPSIYRAQCIARWAQPRYAIDKQFTPLTLLLDQGEEAQGERYQKAREFNDLRDVLKAVDAAKDPVIVVTGAPGSGKSTLLRRLELDLASMTLRSGNPQEPQTIFLSLNAFGQRKGEIPDPAIWVAAHWARMTDGLPGFDTLLRHPLILLLDGLNEMPHTGREDYDDRLAVWKTFLDRLVRDHPHIRVVFSCRTLDYGSKLTTKDLPRVPQVEITPLTNMQVQNFLEIYSPQNAQVIWNQLKDSSQLDLYRSPYYLTLLIKQTSDGKIPEGRAELFTGFVRVMLKREIDAGNPRFRDQYLFHSRDQKRIGQWQTIYELPARVQLFNALALFAFRLQTQSNNGDDGDKSQVRVDYDEALDNLSEKIPDERQRENLLNAAADLQILDLPGDDVLFVHQLLQEYFAARYLAESIDTVSTPEKRAELIELAQVKWREADIKPSVQDELKTLTKSGTLSDLPTTGWEETFLLAAAMVAVPDDFVHVLANVNLPLAGRCAAQPDVVVPDNLRQDLQQQLVERSRDPATDLRARITAGNVLGTLGDPRFEARQGSLGRFLLPPMVAIDGGVYAIGSDEGLYKDEPPRHDVHLAPFALGRFQVTNAEFECFIDAGGYQDQRWWDTPAAQRLQRGEGTGKGRRDNWQHWRNRFKNEVDLLAQLAEEQAWTEAQTQQWQNYCTMTDEAFEAMLLGKWPDQRHTQPAYRNNPAYNAPNQPVVGICWFEARAY